MASDVTTRCAWPGRGESVTELMPFMNFLVHSYSCCSDRHASPYWIFIRRWISMGFTPSLLKKRMTERCSSLVHVTSGPPSLHCYCAVVLYSCIVLPPVSHSSIHEKHCCQLTRQSSCVSNFYRTFKVFIWISLVLSWYQHVMCSVSLTTSGLSTESIRIWLARFHSWQPLTNQILEASPLNCPSHLKKVRLIWCYLDMCHLPVF